MGKQKANYWPHFIAASIFGVFGLCVWTVKKANENPVAMDQFYFDTYQNVELNYNNIILDQKRFDKKYKVDIKETNFILDQNNSLSIEIKKRDNGTAVNDANITVVITRPDSTKFDKHPKVVSKKDGVYEFSSFLIDKPGRWQILSKIKIDNLTSFNKLEVNASK